MRSNTSVVFLACVKGDDFASFTEALHVKEIHKDLFFQPFREMAVCFFQVRIVIQYLLMILMKRCPVKICCQSTELTLCTFVNIKTQNMNR